MVRLLRAVIFIVLILSAVNASANNWYVLKGASGSNNGTSWSNAWNEMNQINFSSVACGDTIWLGGGSYSQGLTINKTCTASSPLTIQSVLSTDAVPTAASGFTSAVLNKVTIVNGGVSLAAGAYVTLSGRQGSAAGNNFGITVQCTTSGGCDAFDGATSGSISSMTISYVEMFGPSCVMASSCGGGGASGFNVAPSSNKVTGIVLDHDWIHQWGEAIRTSNWTNCIVQYTWISDTHNDGMQHEDIVYNYSNANFTMRYNNIWNSPNDGIFFDFGGTTNFQFYGNVYHHSGSQLITYKPGYSYGTIFVYNNTFEDDGKFGDYHPAWLDIGAASGGAVENNVFENLTLSSGCKGTCDYNAYSSSVGKGDGGSHSFTFSAGTLGVGTLFLSESSSNPVVADFHLNATGATTLQNGVALSAPFNTDGDGNTRGANGNWYIGAYQYGAQAQAPQPPTGLKVTVQ